MPWFTSTRLTRSAPKHFNNITNFTDSSEKYVLHFGEGGCQATRAVVPLGTAVADPAPPQVEPH